VTKRAKRADKPNPRADRNYNRNQQSNPGYDAPQDSERYAPKKRRVDLIPRSLTQEKYIKALENEEQYIVFAMGPAGSGKTLLATLYAIKALKEGLVDKIVITRPAVSTDEQHGFLPGSLIDKMAPWVIPIMDVFKEFYHPKQIEKMMEDEQIEIAPLAYMRGRTFKNCIVLGDEMQNATPSQMKMMLTRIGENSKMIVTGDVTQHDRGFTQNGLKDFIERFAKTRSNNITLIQFDGGDVQRHPIIEEILDMYEDVKD
jgi:phosphate starvation-inducible PhoH-like protein